jgi:hypothetical protein
MFGGFVLIVLRRVADPKYSPALTVEDEDDDEYEDDKMRFGERSFYHRWFLPLSGQKTILSQKFPTYECMESRNT